MPLQIVLVHSVVVYSYADFLQIAKYSSSWWMMLYYYYLMLLMIEIVHSDAARYYSNVVGINVAGWRLMVSLYMTLHCIFCKALIDLSLMKLPCILTMRVQVCKTCCILYSILLILFKLGGGSSCFFFSTLLQTSAYTN